MFFVDYDIWTKDTLQDALWTAQPHLKCNDLVTGLAPTIDQARLQYEFGTLTREGAATSSYVAKGSWRGKFVKIQVVGFTSAWYGYIVSEDYDRWPEESDGAGGLRLSGGTQTMAAVGLEWFLTRAMVDSSMVYSGTRIDRAIGYNTGWGDGRDIPFAQRGNKDTRATQFAEDADHRELWTAADIVENLLLYHTPLDRSNDIRPADWTVDFSADAFLNWFEPTVQAAGHSVYQVLNSIISPSRGLVWWVQYDEAGDAIVIHVTSMATVDISLSGGKTLPKALTRTSLTALDTTPGVTGVRVSKDDSRRADQVVCRGALRRAVFTVSPSVGTLEAGWLATEETAYIAAASGEGDYPADTAGRERRNDRFREAQRFERVYQHFQIPTDWDGEVSASVYACPQFVQGSSSVQGPEKATFPALRLSRSLPMVAGWDYADPASPTQRDPTNTDPEWQRPFVVIETDESTHEWRFAHAINTEDEDSGDDRKTGYHMTIASGAAAFQLSPSGGMPHALAATHYDPDTDPPSGHPVEANWENIKATVCAEWDAYCEGAWPIVVGDLPAAGIAISKVIVSLGDRARFDWLAGGTVYDIQDGDLKTVTTAGALRDDRELCEQVARIAYDWYSEDRGTFELAYSTLTDALTLGDLVTTIGNGAAAETINATVSQIAYQLEAGTMRLSAGFAELDFARLV